MNSLNTKSFLERRQALQAELEQLTVASHDELMANINQGLAELKELGFHYRIVGGAGKSKASRVGTRQVKAAPCPVCKFQTSPPHDARAHRGQTEKKRFTATELAAKGFSVVDAGR